MIELAEQDGVAVLRLAHGKVNAMSMEFCEALTARFAEISSARAVVMTATGRTFSAGVDLVRLLEGGAPYVRKFLPVLSEMFATVFSHPAPVVAAINGHAVAGGCILALTADYRILRRGGVQVGLNEVKVGVPLPWSVALLLRASVPAAALTQVALLGRNFADDDAIAVGLADQLADADGFEDFCLARLGEFADKDAASVAVTKGYLRQGVLREMRAREAAEIPVWLDRWFSEPTRERIRRTVATITKTR